MSNQKRPNEPSQKNTLRTTQLVGLNALRRTLERDFFANASISIASKNDSTVELVVHLDCNFGLTESLFHLNNGNWGNFQSCISGDIKTSPFHTTLLELENDNDTVIEIKELSIHLRDTSIIITKLPNCSIQDNLEKILNAISGHFVHFTKGLSKMPYEIFVPIYEETENSFSHAEQKQNIKPDYLKFWGLYFDGEDDSSVYDVKNKVILEQSTFFLLNQWG